jgi:hypothetical protein
MVRTLVCLGLFAVCAALAGAWSAPPRSATKPANAPPAAKPLAKTLSLAEKLRKEVDFAGYEDPKMPLIEALDQLAKLYGVTFDVNEAAFKYEMLNDVLKTPIAETNPIPPMRKVRLGTVLKKILSRIGVPSGATYLIRRDQIEITTGTFAIAEVYTGGGELILQAAGAEDKDAIGGLTARPPLVTVDFRKTPLSEALEALAEDYDINIVLDSSLDENKASTPVVLKVRNLPADTAVLLLASTAGLEVVQLDNALVITTQAKAAALKKAHALRRAKKGVAGPLDEKPKN